MLRFRIINKIESQQFEHPAGPIEFGRGPQRGEVARCVVRDQYFSRDHVRVEELAPTRVRVDNLSKMNPIKILGTEPILPMTSRDLYLPIALQVGETTIEIEPPDAEPIHRESLRTISQPVLSRSLNLAPRSLQQLGSTPSPDLLAHWFETLIAVQRSAAGSAEFYDQTARAVVELVGLDRGLVLLRRGNNWEVVARHARQESQGREFSLTILKHVTEEKRTFYQSNDSFDNLQESLLGVEAVVASPIFDASGEAVGVVYGSRTQFMVHSGAGIGALEAQVVQLLASSVGSGLARLEKEAEATMHRQQFELFFSPKLAQELKRNPRMLEGQQRDVTVLFSDIRGFSRMTERLGPVDTCRLVGEVMETLTARVREFDGVVVDFYGDGLMAMWNAPAEQPDHAAMACRAALAMQADLPPLSAKWRDIIGVPLALGIGLNTGTALVGNVGSRHKFKYGPFGHTVNLASRIEGATKHLGVPALITESTRALLGPTFATRRLSRVRVVGLNEPVNVYELHMEGAAPEWLARRDTYETALTLFESGQWAAACRALYALLEGGESGYDIPSLDLVARAVKCLKTQPEPFDPVLDLLTK